MPTLFSEPVITRGEFMRLMNKVGVELVVTCRAPRDRAADAIAELPPQDRQSNEIIAAIEAAGLEIVERER